MVVTSQQLEKILKDGLQATTVQVKDTSGGCGQAFEVTVVSEQFEGKNRLARHRLVNGLLKKEIAEIHAFTQRNFSPTEWQKHNTEAEQ